MTRAGAGLAALARRAAVAAALAVAGASVVSGCVGQAGAASRIQLATAYVPAPQSPGTTVAYVVIRNNGAADQLVSAHTSVGGTVALRAPARPGSSLMRTVAAIPVPADGTLAMNPGGYHLLITGAGPMRGGKDITLTLVFARAGPLAVVAQVTNPQTGGSSYFLN